MPEGLARDVFKACNEIRTRNAPQSYEMNFSLTMSPAALSRRATSSFGVSIIRNCIIQDAALEYDPAQHHKLIVRIGVGRADVVYASLGAAGY